MKSASKYKKLAFWFGWCGAHCFYLNEWNKGCLYILTFGFMYLGVFNDLYFANQKVDQYNAKRGYVKIIQ